MPQSSLQFRRLLTVAILYFIGTCILSAMLVVALTRAELPGEVTAIIGAVLGGFVQNGAIIYRRLGNFDGGELARLKDENAKLQLEVKLLSDACLQKQTTLDEIYKEIQND